MPAFFLSMVLLAAMAASFCFNLLGVLHRPLDGLDEGYRSRPQNLGCQPGALLLGDGLVTVFTERDDVIKTEELERKVFCTIFHGEYLGSRIFLCNGHGPIH